MEIIIWWKERPLKWGGFAVVGPMSFSSAHNAWKFSAVLGTISASNSKTILPTHYPPVSTLKNTWGLAELEFLTCGDRCNISICRQVWEQGQWPLVQLSAQTRGRMSPAKWEGVHSFLFFSN
jgi:hypothetical protein